MNVPSPVLMVVTDPGIPDLGARVADALGGGATWIQYRDKTATAEERVRWVEAFKERHPDAVLLVNDDLIAAERGRADGLHMSQGCAGLSDARTLLGPNALIGRSLHTGYDEPEAHHRPGLDYAVFGTVFASASHPNGPVAGLETLAGACRRRLPVLAIGGVTAGNAGDCIRAGAAGVAVIRSVLAAPDPARAAAEILQVMREVKS
jgi:thiamine-phosphate diphosphorylase